MARGFSIPSGDMGEFLDISPLPVDNTGTLHVSGTDYYVHMARSSILLRAHAGFKPEEFSLGEVLSHTVVAKESDGVVYTPGFPLCMFRFASSSTFVSFSVMVSYNGY